MSENGNTHRARGIVLWVLASLIMVFSAAYQRTTGPTYPVEGETDLAGRTITYELTRSHGGEGDQPVTVPYPADLPAGRVQGVIHWRRLGTDDRWGRIPMHVEGDSEGENALVGHLPHQPPAGKLDYRVELRLVRGTSGGGQGVTESVLIPEKGHVTTRFKGAVPAWALVPHILFMFLGMLWSTRAGLEALFRDGDPRRLARTAFGLLFVGGMILGPVVQEFAFDAFWTGVPFGWDLTDNKTLISVLAWGAALWAMRGGRTARRAVLAASIVTLVIYLIPHSLMGSTFDYAEGEITTG
ncbi:MAG: hypothetical protein R6W82_03330 [bacterium]